MNKELVGCCFCEAVFERDVMFSTSSAPSSLRPMAACDACIRRKDLQEKVDELLQSLSGELE